MSGRLALIVGAGIGGLAAAIALRRAGWEIRVVERAASPRELGFALLLAPNAMRVLRTLGLADVVCERGVVITRGEIRRPDGHVLRAFDASGVSKILGEPGVAVLRSVLHGELLEAVGSSALDLASEVVAARQSNSHVQIALAGGEVVSGDVLIGADGVGSIVRRALHPGEGPPRPSGLIAVRGVAYGATNLLRGSSGSQYLGRGIETGAGRVSEDAIYWYVSVREKYVASLQQTAQNVVARCTSDFHDTFRSIVAATRPEDMRLDRLFDRDPIDAWGRGRITLLGDAAHPMLPHAGQGAAQALEDAVALGRALSTSADPDGGLRNYERIRGKRTRAIVSLSRRNARLGSLENAAAIWLRDTCIGLVPARVILASLIALGRPAEEG